MKKLLVLTLLFALALTATPVLAHDGGMDRIAGEITALDGATGVITVQPRYGDPVTVQTSAETEFYRKVPQGGLEAIAFEDLTVGDRIAVEGAWDGDLFNADKVVVVAPTTPPPPAGDSVHGVIAALDAATGVITVQTPAGAQVTVQTSAETEFYQVRHHGDLEPITFDDLVVGEGVRAKGAWNGDVFEADRVIAMPTTPPPPPEMVSGTIAALDADAGTITVQTCHDAAPLTVQTSAETEFYRMVHDGGLEEITFDDLVVGDRIAAEGEWDGDMFNAGKVVTTPATPPPPPAETIKGTITALDEATGMITVQDMDDSTVTVQTSAETKFYRMNHDGSLAEITFADLNVGDHIVVEGSWDGDVFNASNVVVMAEVTTRARIQPVQPIRARIQPGQFGATQRP